MNDEQFAQFVLSRAERIDNRLHSLRRCPWFPLRRTICVLADISYGWGPDAADWPQRTNWFSRWIERVTSEPSRDV